MGAVAHFILTFVIGLPNLLGTASITSIISVTQTKQEWLQTLVKIEEKSIKQPKKTSLVI